MKILLSFFFGFIIFNHNSIFANDIGFEFGSVIGKAEIGQEYLGLNYSIDSIYKSKINVNFSYLFDGKYNYGVSVRKDFFKFSNYDLFLDIGLGGDLKKNGSDPFLGLGVYVHQQNYQLMYNRTVFSSYRTYPFTILYKYQTSYGDSENELIHRNDMHMLSLIYYFGV